VFWEEGRAGDCREIAVEVIEEYRAPYVGPHDAAHNVTELLTYVPSRYLHLLERWCSPTPLVSTRLPPVS
jgi:hypothetical protein